MLREERFKALFETYKKPLHDYIHAIIGSHDAAEEIAQEVFVRLWKRLGQEEPIGNPDHYLYKMARNQCMDHFKKMLREVKFQGELRRSSPSEHSPVTDHLDRKDTEDLIGKAVATLPPQRRRVYELSRQEGLKLDEIADQLQISRNTTRNHLSEALRQIREYFTRYHSGA